MFTDKPSRLDDLIPKIHNHQKLFLQLLKLCMQSKKVYSWTSLVYSLSDNKISFISIKILQIDAESR